MPQLSAVRQVAIRLHQERPVGRADPCVGSRSSVGQSSGFLIRIGVCIAIRRCARRIDLHTFRPPSSTTVAIKALGSGAWLAEPAPLCGGQQIALDRT